MLPFRPVTPGFTRVNAGTLLPGFSFCRRAPSRRASSSELRMASDRLLERGLMVCRNVARVFGRGPAPLCEPVSSEQFTSAAEPGINGLWCKRDGRLHLFAGVAAFGDEESRGKKCRPVRRRASISEKLCGAEGARPEEFAKGRESPKR